MPAPSLRQRCPRRPLAAACQAEQRSTRLRIASVGSRRAQRRHRDRAAPLARSIARHRPLRRASLDRRSRASVVSIAWPRNALQARAVQRLQLRRGRPEPWRAASRRSSRRPALRAAWPGGRACRSRTPRRSPRSRARPDSRAGGDAHGVPLPEQSSAARRLARQPAADDQDRGPRRAMLHTVATTAARRSPRGPVRPPSGRLQPSRPVGRH